MATRYRRRAVDVEAFRVGHPEPDWWLALTGSAAGRGLTTGRAPLAKEGDWVVRHPDGRIQVYDPAAFDAAFEEVPR